jgi:kynureninase
MYVAPRLQADLDQPLSGWMGHARPFDMELGYEPVAGVGRLASGTPPVLALSALEAALGVFDGVDPAELRAASLSLTDYFIELVDVRGPFTLEFDLVGDAGIGRCDVAPV